MKLATFCYEGHGWSRRFPDLDSERTLVLAFAAPGFAARPGPMIELASAYPRAKLIGCSAAGAIDQTQIRDGSISVAVVQFEQTQVMQAEAQVDGTTDAFAAGQRIAAQLASPELRAVVVLAPGMPIDALELVKGLNARLPAKVIVTGGLAGDSEQPGKTWVVSGGRIEADKVVAVGLYGDRVRVSWGSRGGGETVGGEAAVSRSPDRVVEEAHAAGAAAANQFEGPVLCMAVSGVGRRVVLGEHAERETEATLEGLPVGTAQIGFYSSGEIALDAAGQCALHHHTMTLTVLSEMA